MSVTVIQFRTSDSKRLRTRKIATKDMLNREEGGSDSAFTAAKRYLETELPGSKLVSVGISHR